MATALYEKILGLIQKHDIEMQAITDRQANREERTVELLREARCLVTGLHTQIKLKDSILQEMSENIIAGTYDTNYILGLIDKALGKWTEQNGKAQDKTPKT